jgi:arylsulfatase A-like enzyme
VPLIVRPPAGVASGGTVIEERVGTVDIVPTILDLLGIGAPAAL